MVWTLASDLDHFKHPVALGFTIEERILRDFFEGTEEKARAHWDPHLYGSKCHYHSSSLFPGQAVNQK